MIQLIRSNSSHPDFIKMVTLLNKYLEIIDGDQHEFYHQYNGVESLNHVVLAYSDNTIVGCGAFKPYNDAEVEIKRMFVDPELRGKKIGTKVLMALETWAQELKYKSIVLETGKRMVDAIALYKKNGYLPIENYGPYVGVDNSVCFRKRLHIEE